LFVSMVLAKFKYRLGRADVLPDKYLPKLWRIEVLSKRQNYSPKDTT
jgi:hypothetical protein